MPQKSTGSLKMEVVVLNFGCRTTVRLNTAIEKTIEKCVEFYKGIHFVHNECMVLTSAPEEHFPVTDEHLKNLLERLQKGEEIISKIEVVSDEDIRIWTIQASCHLHALTAENRFPSLWVHSDSKIPLTGACGLKLV